MFCIVIQAAKTIQISVINRPAAIMIHCQDLISFTRLFYSLYGTGEGKTLAITSISMKTGSPKGLASGVYACQAERYLPGCEGAVNPIRMTAWLPANAGTSDCSTGTSIGSPPV